MATPIPNIYAASTAYRSAEKDPALQGVSYSGSPEEVHRLLGILESEQFIKTMSFIEGVPESFCLTAKGMVAADDMTATSSASAQGFVAMSFRDTLKEVWTNGFDPAIRAAGFRPFRIDGKDYVDGITDEIMAEIRRSKFIVADYTEQNNGVYFEAGFALGLGLTVIPTCRIDELEANKLHFDIKHLNTLGWTTPQDLADRLAQRILAIIGSGPDLTIR